MENRIEPDTVYLHVTKKCNLRCVYCYFEAGDPMERELTTREMTSLLKDIDAIRPRRVIFTGGEPLLRTDIFQLAQKLHDEGCGITLGITTNGILLNEANSRQMVESFDEIRISIDGFEGVNDSIRGKGTFQKAMTAFQWIIKAGGSPAAFITVTSRSLPGLKDFMYFLIHSGVRKIHVSPLRLIGRASIGDWACDFDKVSIAVRDFWVDTFGIDVLSKDKNESFNCGAGKFISIYPDGSVYPCHVLTYPEFHLGNVREQSLTFLYDRSPLMRELRNLHYAEIDQCQKCFDEKRDSKTCLGLFARTKEFRAELRDTMTHFHDPQNSD